MNNTARAYRLESPVIGEGLGNIIILASLSNQLGVNLHVKGNTCKLCIQHYGGSMKYSESYPTRSVLDTQVIHRNLRKVGLGLTGERASSCVLAT